MQVFFFRKCSFDASIILLKDEEFQDGKTKQKKKNSLKSSFNKDFRYSIVLTICDLFEIGNVLGKNVLDM